MKKLKAAFSSSDKPVEMTGYLQGKKTILVTGSNGQLGKELQALSFANPFNNFLFTGRQDLPIEDDDLLNTYFEKQHIDYCINSAAYTAVDNAETEQEKAFEVNGFAVGNLAKACSKHNTQLIHISTDYVFDGTASTPYNEGSSTAPVSAYGASKLQGEELAFRNNSSTIIIRASWLYSAFGNNFVKTMLRLMKEKESVNVVDDQFGCPTYAADLAEVIIKIIDRLQNNNDKNFAGIYNFCNAGITNWFQFALAIKSFTTSTCIINPIPSSQYKTAAKRPQYSVLDTSKIKSTFNIAIPEWKDSLKKCISLSPGSDQ